MKHTKKLISLLLVLVMALSMSVTAFAAGDTGTITVDNPKAEEEYTAYKIFDVVYNADKSAYSYTIENAQDSWFADVIAYMGSEWTTDEESGSESYSGDPAVANDKGIYTGNGITLTPSASDASVYVVGLDETSGADKFSAADFARYLKNCTGHTGVPLTTREVNGKSVQQATNLPLGYYFVSSTTGALCNLTTTNPEVTIHDKNDVPFEKTDDQESVEVGETVNYTIKGKVPDTTGFATYIYKITDTMSTGLTFKKDVKIYLSDDEELITETTPGKTTDSELDAKYYKKADTANGFEVSFDAIQMNTDGLFDKYIFLKYSATTNENAVAVISKNNAILTYSNDPTDGSKTTTRTDEETVYSAKIVIDKYEHNSENESDTSKKLAGASFVLYKGSTGSELYYHYHAKSATDPTDVAKVEWKNLDDIITAINGEVAGTLKDGATLADVLKLDKTFYEDYITVVTTNGNGAANFDGLEDGTYHLLETAAPAGYNLLDAPVSVKVDGSKATETDPTSLTATSQVANNTGSLLPSTGGMGTTIFYVVGSILLIGAAVLLITRKRMNSVK